MARARKKCRRTRFKFAEIRRDLAMALDLGGNKAIQDVEWHSGVMSPPFILDDDHQDVLPVSIIGNYHSKINDADKVRPLR